MPEQINNATPQRARRPGQSMTAEEKQVAQEVFLEAFAVMANVRAACKKAGIDRSTVYKWQEHDEEFGFKFRQASADANDMLLAAAWQRGVQGVQKPILYRGGIVYETDKQSGERKMVTVTEYSDTLLSLLLKARLPEFRAVSKVELATGDNAPIQVHLYLPEPASETVGTVRSPADGLPSQGAEVLLALDEGV